MLSACLICLCAAGCDGREPPTPAAIQHEIKAVAEKTVAALDLSIDNIPLEPIKDNGGLFLTKKTPTEENSELFEALSKDQAEASIDFSGKLLTDEEKLANRQYLDSVVGVQINIKGKFE